MRILHVTATDARRGAERHAIDLAEALGGFGLSSEIRSVRASRRVDSLPIESLGGGRFSPRGVLELRRLLKDVNVAIAHGSTSLPATALASIGTGTPFVYRGIGDPLYWSSTPARRLRTAAFLRRTAAITVLWSGSAATLAQHFGVPATKITVLPNAVNSRRFPAATTASRLAARRTFALPEHGQILACVGSLSPEKRVDRAIDVVSYLDDVTLVIVGDGPERGPLASRADTLPAGRVRFLGNVADPSEAYAASDALLLTSDTEGLPGVIIEAAFCGRAAIATRVGGVSDAVVDGHTGATADANDLEGLVSAARAVLSNSVALGAAARDYCLGKFEIGVVARLWEKLLRAVAGEAAR